MNPVPFTWMLVAMLLIAVGAGGTGFHYGGKIVRAEWDSANAMAVLRNAEDSTFVIKADSKVGQKFDAKRAARAEQQKSIAEKVAIHVQTIPDSPECALSTERVSNINDSFGVASDPGKQAPAVSNSYGLKRRATQHSGEVGNGDGSKVPAVQ